MEKQLILPDTDFALTASTLAYMQESYSFLEKLCALGGDSYYLSGCELGDYYHMSPGIIVLRGEVMPFVGGNTMVSPNFRIVRNTTRITSYNVCYTKLLRTPKNAKDFDRFKISEWFREGDPVEVWLGYDGELELEFSGYITKVSAGIPLVINCEDEMYKLKRNVVSVSKQDCGLKELLEAIAPGYKVVCDNTHLVGNVRYSKKAASEILEDLKQKGIYSWFEGKELHAFNKSKSDIDPVDVKLEETAGESLKQKAIEDTMVIISLIRKKGKKLNVEYGDQGAGKRLRKELSGMNITEVEMRKEAVITSYSIHYTKLYEY